MPPLRISAISFLNTAPLMWDFENGEPAARLRESFAIGYTIPSRCAEQLKEGSADIGIIPVAAYPVIPDLVIVPDVAIAAKNKVRSILLVSKVPMVCRKRWGVTSALPSDEVTPAAWQTFWRESANR